MLVPMRCGAPTLDAVEDHGADGRPGRNGQLVAAVGARLAELLGRVAEDAMHAHCFLRFRLVGGSTPLPSWLFAQLRCGLLFAILVAGSNG